MTEDKPDDRSLMALAVEWTTRMMTIGFEMSLPAAAGYWLDLRFRTGPAFLVVGAVLGFAIGMFQLLRIAQPQSPKKKS